MITEPLLGPVLPLYSLLISLAAVLGLGFSVWRQKKNYRLYTDWGLGLLAGSLLGSRVGYVMFHLGYYVNNWQQIPLIWKGGANWIGALLGFSLVLLVFSFLKKIPLYQLLDIYLPLMGLLTTAVWLASWGAASGYGPETISWWGVPVQDVFGVTSRRWPLPILGGGLSLTLTLGLLFLPLEKWFPSRRWKGWTGLTGLLLIHSALSFFKVDPAPRLGQLRIETWISSLITLVVGTSYPIYQRMLPDEETET